MNFLIIDNGTKLLTNLEELFDGFEYDIVSLFDIRQISLDKYNAIVLSGGHSFPIIGNDDKLSEEIAIIKDSNKPIFGICFGFELIAHIFGSKLVRLPEKEKGLNTLEIIVKDPIFNNISKLRVYEGHKWVVEEVGDALLALAKSNDGIETVRHRELPIYGVQFHPEMSRDTCGKILIRNFVDIITQRSTV